MMSTQEARVRDRTISLKGKRMIAELYQKHRGRLHGFLHHRLPTPEAVGDVESEVWTRAVRGVDSLREPPAAGAWLYRIAGNVISSYYRTMRRANELPEADAPLVLTMRLGPSRYEPEAELETELALVNILQLASQMPALHRDVFLMLASGYDYKDIAECLRLTSSAVRVIVHRLRRRLAEGLGRPIRPIRRGCVLCARGERHGSCRPQ